MNLGDKARLRTVYLNLREPADILDKLKREIEDAYCELSEEGLHGHLVTPMSKLRKADSHLRECLSVLRELTG